MATKTYEFVDDETGQAIVFDGPDDATPEEIADVLDQMSGQAQSASPSRTPQPPVDTQPQEPGRAPEVTIFDHGTSMNEYRGGSAAPTTSYGTSRVNRPDVEAALEALYQSGERDPARFNAMLQTQFPDLSPEERPFATPEILARADAFTKYYNENPHLTRPQTFMVNQDTGIPEPEAPETTAGELGQGVQRGLSGLANTATGLAGVAADVVGADETAQVLVDKYVRDSVATELHYGATVDSVRDIESWSDAGRYAVAVIGEFLPQIATGVGTGMIGREIAERAAANTVARIVEERMAAGMTREAAEQFAARTAQQWAARGMTAGAAANSIGQETGSVYGDTYAQTGVRAPGLAIAAGTVAGALDAVLPSRIGNQLTSEMRDRFTNRILREGAQGFALEGATEAAQTFIEALPRAVITGESPFTEEMYLQMEEAFVRGGIGGGATSAATSMFTGSEPGTPARPSLNGNFGLTNTISRPTANPRRATRLYPAQLQQTAQEMADRVNTLTESWTERPNITVHPDFKKVEGIDNDALGAYVNGEIILNAENLIAEADARGLSIDNMVAGVTFHEALGHHALTREYGDGLNTLLDSFYYNGSPEFRNTVDRWMDDNPEAYQGDPNREARATEEVLAEYAERDGQLTASMMDQVKNYIKDFARRAGINLAVSEREVKAILAVAQRNFVEGRGTEHTPSDGTRYMYVGRGAQTANIGNLEDAINAAVRAGIDPAEVGLPAKYAKTTKKFRPAIKMPDGTTYVGEPNSTHFQVYEDNPEADFDNMAEDGDGFVDDEGKFYTRKEAAAVLGRSGKLNELYTEDYKYARKSKPKKEALTLEDLTAEELVESRNALSMVDHLVEDIYSKTSFTNDELTQEVLSRGVPPSAIVKRLNVEPGKLTKDMIRYDIAAQKLNARLSQLYGKMVDGSATQKDRVEFTKTSLALDDVASNLFGLQSEFGRALQAIQKMEYTQKKLTSLREALKGIQGVPEGLYALDDPATFLRYAKGVMEQMEAKTPKTSTTGDKIVSMLNLPRAVMSSMDLSAPLRQGLYFINKGAFWRSLPSMFKAFNPKNGEAFYKEVMTSIQANPNYDLMMRGGLSLTSLDGPVGKAEEQFASDLAQKIPGVRMSERAYVGFLNKLRADVFSQYVTKMRDAGIDVENKETLRALGAWVNAGTGRGNLPKQMEGAAPMLNALFFSPRLISSRVTLLSSLVKPSVYGKMPKTLRNEIIKQNIAFGSIAILTLGLISQAIPEAEVEYDPRSSDFGKVKIGNTRYDILGGFSQYFTLGGRLAAYSAGMAGFDVGGDRKTTSGQLVEYSNEFGATNALDAVIDFFRNKLSPNASFVTDFLADQNTVGEEFTLSGAAMSRMLPMVVQDFAELTAEHGFIEGAAMTAPVIFGVGVNTYVPKALDTAQKLTVQETFKATGYADSSNDFVTISGEDATLTEAGMNLWTDALNEVFADVMEQRIAEDDWAGLSDLEKAAEIQKAKDTARTETRRYVYDQIGM